MTQEVLKMALEALENNKQTHYYCDNTWYSCPKHEDGCANEFESDECNCGSDKINAEFDKAIAAIKEALAQPEQDIAALVTGMEVSIDVSTGDHDSGNRLFGVVDLVQQSQGSKHGLILLVQETKANFKEKQA
jgi:hypothetical protein